MQICGEPSGPGPVVEKAWNMRQKRVSGRHYDMAKLLLGKQNVIWSLPGAWGQARGVF